MAKKKGRSRRAKARARKATANPIIRGQEALHRGEYDEAIAAWEQARQENPPATLTAALAEVYFRRGLLRFYRWHQHEAGLSDLDEAAHLVPGDAHYAYHLGLAHHHQDNLGAAITAYRLVLDADPTFTRAAELAVLVSLEQGKDPTQDAAWSALPSERQAELSPLVRLVLAEPPRATSTSTGPARRCPEPCPEPRRRVVEGLWQGLAALESGDDRAHSALQNIAQDDNQPAPVRAVAAYTLGLDALRHDRPAEALAHWESARRLGLDTPAFHDNLYLLYHTCAEQSMTDGQWAEAAALADAALDLLPADHDLRDLAAAAHFHAGHADAQVVRWDHALEHWEKARELGENGRILFQNLALAYEKTERFLEAAELWREVVRRRPRKANAPDALTSQQVSLLWGHVAECYRRAGDVEEAITTLRNAVKSDPDNADLRLELVDALTANEHWDAASNEVGRILKREPGNLNALVRAARLDEGGGYLAHARQTWKKVVELDPNHLEARERLAELLHREGDRLCRFGDLDGALESYGEALVYMPDEPHLYISLAECHFHKNDPDAARREMDRAFALNPADLGVYHIAVDACHIANHPDDAEWVITRAKELAGPLPAGFYVDLAHCCFNRRQTKIGNDYLRRAEQAAEGDPDGLVHVALFYLDRKDESQAIAYLQQALRLDPEHGLANLHIGASYAAAMEMREARRHWRQARRTARRTGDEELLRAIETFRQYFQRAIDMLERGVSPFEMLGGLDLEMFDDDYDDDDEYW